MSKSPATNCQWIRQSAAHSGEVCDHEADYLVEWLIAETHFWHSKRSCAAHLARWTSYALMYKGNRSVKTSALKDVRARDRARTQAETSSV